MTNKKSSDSRRKLLKSILTGSGAVLAGKSLPESWSKPVVKGILLPAHAATTMCNPEYSFVEVEDGTRASYSCGGSNYILYCYTSPPGSADVQVEISGTGVCAVAQGTHNTSSDGFVETSIGDDPYTTYKWNIGGISNCGEPPDSFTAVFSIVEGCDEPIVVEGSIRSCP